jgi:hypothetical protein
MCSKLQCFTHQDLVASMLRQLNIVGKHFLSVSKARELSVLSDVYSGPGTPKTVQENRQTFS